MIDTVNSSSVPLSTRIIQASGETAQNNVVPSQTDPSIIATPENINTFTDKAEDTAQTIQERAQAEQEAVRSLAVNINNQQHQQDLVEQFISQSTDSTQNSSSTSVYDATEQYQQLNNTETVGNVLKAQDQFSDAITPREPSYFHIQV